MKTLTKKQIDEYSKRLVENGIPTRFMEGGQACNIITGDKSRKGTNVINQKAYWNLPKELALEIAEVTGTKAVFSDEETS